MSDAKKQLHIHTLARVLIIAGLVVFVNIAISPFSVKFDLTQEKRFTMARATKEIVQGLQNEVTIKAFISKEIPENLFRVRQDLRDLLNEYDKVGGSNVSVEYFDPKTDPAAANEAKNLGITEIQFNTFGDETFEISSGYFGFALLYEDKNEIFPVVQNTDNLELEITQTIRKMSRAKTPVIGLATGQGEGLEQPVQNELAKQYEIRPIDMQNGQLIADDVDVLLLVGPKEPYSQRELFVIDQFVMSQRPLLVFADGVEINQQFFTGSPVNTNINNILTEYGIAVNNDIAVDLLSQEALQFSSGLFVIVQPYAAWPKIISAGIEKNHAISASLRSLTFPWPSTLLVTAPNDDQTQNFLLLQTSPETYSLSGESIILNPEALDANANLPRQQQVLGALVQGQLQSAFAGKQIPVNPNNTESETIIAQTNSGTVLVFGSSRILQTNVINQSPENFILLGNALESLSSGQSLSQIRARNSNARPIEILTAQKQQNIKYGNILASVIISLLVGLAAYFWRKRQDKLAQLQYTD